MGRRVLDLERRLLLDTDGMEERLAPGEFNLLKLFVENPNRPLARDWLLEVTSHREAEAFDRAIDLRITRLRRKIERDPAPPRGDPHRPRCRLYVRARKACDRGSDQARHCTSVYGGIGFVVRFEHRLDRRADRHGLFGIAQQIADHADVAVVRAVPPAPRYTGRGH